MFGQKGRTSVGTDTGWACTFADEGVWLVASEMRDELNAQHILSLMHQLEDEGYVERLHEQDELRWLLSWQSVYSLSNHKSYAGSLAALNVPKIVDAVPYVESHGSLTDDDFTITVARWVDKEGRSIRFLELQ